MTWLVVVNPHAGNATPPVDAIRGLLEASAVANNLVVTETPDDVQAAVDRSVAAGVTSFATVGGDGSAHVLVNAVMRHPWPHRPKLAVIASGSGTDLLRTFALDRGLEPGVRRLVDGDPYTMDLGRIDLGDGGRRWFINVTDVGVAAASVRTAQRMPRRIGPVRYPAAFWLTLPWFRPAPVVVRSERHVVADLALNIVIANGQFFGGGMNVAPQAAISDGLLDVEIFIGPRVRALSVMPRVIRGLHLRHKAVKTMRAPRFEIEVPDAWPIEADGDLIGTGSLSVDVVPAAVDLMI